MTTTPNPFKPRIARLGTNRWTPTQWALFRQVLGIYLTVHFTLLLPYAGELFGGAGLLPEASLSPLMGYLPNPLGWDDVAWMPIATVGAGAFAGAMITLGRAPRLWAAVAWYVGACLLMRNPLILNPALPHVGWTLLWFVAVPPPEERRPWHLPAPLYATAWAMMSASLSWSAYTKLGSVSWMDGSALYHLWNNPLARDTALLGWLTALPAEVYPFLTWGTLALEFAALPALFFRPLRPAVWWGMLAMHLALIATIDFADLSVGMIVCHVALFDRDLLPRRRTLSLRPPAPPQPTP